MAQFAPATLGGIFWKGGTRRGALAGLIAGFVVWSYTLLLPALARSGWLPIAFLEQGPWGIELLKPLELFGLKGLDQITHAMIWSMIANMGAYVAVSLAGSPGAEEHGRRACSSTSSAARAAARVLARHRLGARAAQPARALPRLARRRPGVPRLCQRARLRWPQEDLPADAELVHSSRPSSPGAIGAASARIMVASVVEEEALTLDEVRKILDEASQVIMYSHQLEQKSRELEAATAELRAANERLKELDRLKDDFLSTVTELRTPLTSIRAFTEILSQDPDIDLAQRRKFLGIVVKETERLTRLINQVLDLAKIESGRAEWHETRVDMREVISDTVTAMEQVFQEKGIRVSTRMPDRVSPVRADLDRMIQVMLNLLSNAVKFCDPAPAASR